MNSHRNNRSWAAVLVYIVLAFILIFPPIAGKLRADSKISACQMNMKKLGELLTAAPGTTIRPGKDKLKEDFYIDLVFRNRRDQPEILLCPATLDEVDANWEKAVEPPKFRTDPNNCSYFGPIDDFAHELIINAGANEPIGGEHYFNHADGVNVLFGDTHVRFYEWCDFGFAKDSDPYNPFGSTWDMQDANIDLMNIDASETAEPTRFYKTGWREGVTVTIKSYRPEDEIDMAEAKKKTDELGVKLRILGNALALLSQELATAKTQEEKDKLTAEMIELTAEMSEVQEPYLPYQRAAETGFTETHFARNNFTIAGDKARIETYAKARAIVFDFAEETVLQIDYASESFRRFTLDGYAEYTASAEDIFGFEEGIKNREKWTRYIREGFIKKATGEEMTAEHESATARMEERLAFLKGFRREMADTADTLGKTETGKTGFTKAGEKSERRRRECVEYRLPIADSTLYTAYIADMPPELSRFQELGTKLLRIYGRERIILHVPELYTMVLGLPVEIRSAYGGWKEYIGVKVFDSYKAERIDPKVFAVPRGFNEIKPDPEDE